MLFKADFGCAFYQKFEKNICDHYYEPTIVVHDEQNGKFQFWLKYTYYFLFT